MRNVRIIPRLDIKGKNLIKGIQLEGLRKVGEPNNFAKKYYEEGADEILYMDAVASLYNRDNIKDIISQTAKDIFIPITVGGGIKSIKNALEMFSAGADKIAINSAAVNNPQIIKDLANKFGSQSIVISIEAKSIKTNRWEIFTESGRKPSGIMLEDWIRQISDFGCGEILLTSIDNDGTEKGFDLDLAKFINDKIKIPIIVSGGMGKIDDVLQLIENTNIDAVSMASVLHFNKIEIGEIKSFLAKRNLSIQLKH